MYKTNSKQLVVDIVALLSILTSKLIHTVDEIRSVWESKFILYYAYVTVNNTIHLDNTPYSMYCSVQTPRH